MSNRPPVGNPRCPADRPSDPRRREPVPQHGRNVPGRILPPPAGRQWRSGPGPCGNRRPVRIMGTANRARPRSDAGLKHLRKAPAPPPTSLSNLVDLYDGRFLEHEIAVPSRAIGSKLRSTSGRHRSASPAASGLKDPDRDRHRNGRLSTGTCATGRRERPRDCRDDREGRVDHRSDARRIVEGGNGPGVGPRPARVVPASSPAAMGVNPGSRSR